MAGGGDTTVKVDTPHALNQGVGYGIVIGLGAVFALGELLPCSLEPINTTNTM